MSLKGYDEWKLSTPDYYEQDDIVAGKCYFCESKLYHGDEVYYDSRDDSYFCDKQCFILNERDKLDELIDKLEDGKDTYETTIEAELEEDE